MPKHKNSIDNTKVPVYLSMHIRGPHGNDPEKIAANIAKAKLVAYRIRAKIPELELFVPHEWEPLLQACLNSKCITVPQILDYDCAVIRLCKVLIIGSTTHDSEGCLLEVKHALDHNVIVTNVDTEYDAYPTLLRKYLRMKGLIDWQYGRAQKKEATDVNP